MDNPIRLDKVEDKIVTSWVTSGQAVNTSYSVDDRTLDILCSYYHELCTFVHKRWKFNIADPPNGFTPFQFMCVLAASPPLITTTVYLRWTNASLEDVCHAWSLLGECVKRSMPEHTTLLARCQSEVRRFSIDLPLAACKPDINSTPLRDLRIKNDLHNPSPGHYVELTDLTHGATRSVRVGQKSRFELV
jgi:hypothetical protein